jgi:hypothetical protein
VIDHNNLEEFRDPQICHLQCDDLDEDCSVIERWT